MVFENETGCVYAELDVRTGEFECNFYINDFLPSRADLIVVLDQGVVVEMGDHKELIQKGGVYNKLYQTQFAGLDT